LRYYKWILVLLAVRGCRCADFQSNGSLVLHGEALMRRSQGRAQSTLQPLDYTSTVFFLSAWLTDGSRWDDNSRNVPVFVREEEDVGRGHIEDGFNLIKSSSCREDCWRQSTPPSKPPTSNTLLW